MHSLRQIEPYHREHGWPRWLLLATAPVVTALGVLTGVLIAAYTEPLPPPPVPAQVAANPAPAETAPPQQTAPANPAPATTVSPSPPLPEPVRTDSPPAPTMGPVEAASDTTTSTPPAPHVPGPVADIREARLELSHEFSTYSSDLVRIPHIDYQQMKNRGLGTSLVGIMSLNGYEQWTKALREEPDKLQAWLESAARRAIPAMQRDRFFISWAVVDVRPAVPAGFAEHEITPLTNGSYLIVRPLASTQDPEQASVALRPLSSVLTGARTGSAFRDPWLTYGPIIRFDGTDLYRPPGLSGTKPKN